MLVYEVRSNGLGHGFAINQDFYSQCDLSHLVFQPMISIIRNSKSLMPEVLG